MGQPKYYTPELSEFHEGFEFELAVYSHKMVKMPPTWKKQTYKIGMALQKDGKASEKWRVRHLDGSDFESLGLSICTDNIDYTVYESSEGWRILFHKDYLFGDMNVTIYNSGYCIRNKAELKKLLGFKKYEFEERVKRGTA